MALVALLCSLALAGDVYLYIAPDGTPVLTDSPTHDGFELFWTDPVPGAYLPNGVPMPRLDRIPGLDAYDAHLAAAADANGLPAELIKAVAVAESRMNPRARSHAGAEGLMQLIPGTAKRLGVTDTFDPAQSIAGGAAYLADQVARFGTFELALAAYNAGPGNVSKYGGIPPFKETQTYVARVMGLYAHFTSERPVRR